jgi:hypothetical protein
MIAAFIFGTFTDARDAPMSPALVCRSHGDGSGLPMLVQSGNLSPEIRSSGGYRLSGIQLSATKHL